MRNLSFLSKNLSRSKSNMAGFEGHTNQHFVQKVETYD